MFIRRFTSPSALPFRLMASDHNILIPMEDDTFELQVENIYVSKEDVF